MRQQAKRYIVFLWALTMTFCTALAQITGVVVDAGVDDFRGTFIQSHGAGVIAYMVVQSAGVVVRMDVAVRHGTTGHVDGVAVIVATVEPAVVDFRVGDGAARHPNAASAPNVGVASEGGAAMRMLSNHRGPHSDCMLLLRNCKRALTVSASCRTVFRFVAGRTVLIFSNHARVP